MVNEVVKLVDNVTHHLHYRLNWLMK